MRSCRPDPEERRGRWSGRDGLVRPCPAWCCPARPSQRVRTIPLEASCTCLFFLIGSTWIHPSHKDNKNEQTDVLLNEESRHDRPRPAHHPHRDRVQHGGLSRMGQDFQSRAVGCHRRQHGACRHQLPPGVLGVHGRVRGILLLDPRDARRVLPARDDVARAHHADVFVCSIIVWSVIFYILGGEEKGTAGERREAYSQSTLLCARSSVTCLSRRGHRCRSSTRRPRVPGESCAGRSRCRCRRGRPGGSCRSRQ